MSTTFSLKLRWSSHHLYIFLLLSMGLWLVTAVPTSNAAVTAFVVNSTSDGADVQAGDGICADGTGHCTLRAAMMQANASGGINPIHFNIPGTGPQIIQPQTALPLLEEAVIIDGYTQPGAHPNTNPAPLGLNTQLMIVLDGSQASNAFGFSWSFDTSTIDGLVIRGLVIHSFSEGAIGSYYEELYDVINARFVGNFIGTDVTGTEARGEGSRIMLAGGPRFKNIDIGGVNLEDRNLINGSVGIYSRYALLIQIQGNLIGTDISGQQSLGNGYGIFVRDACPVLIGGAESGATNVISGSRTHGIELDGNDGCTTVRGNLIGVASDGHTPIENSGAGIHAAKHAGVAVEGNRIAYNQGNGITVGFYSYSTIVSNLISGNGGDGIKLETGSFYTIIQDNLIGLAADGRTSLGNGGSGINAVGRAGVVADNNHIAYNQENGFTILQYDSYLASPSPNFLFNNGGLGIDLLNDGVTPNDPLDSDSGPNGLQNYPTLESVVHSSGNVTVSGNLHSWPNRTYILWLFTNAQCDPSGYGEGEAFATEMIVTTDGSGNAPFTAVFPQQAELPFVTAIASYNGATSEFSQCRADPLYLVTLLRAEVQQLIDDGVLAASAGTRLLIKLDNVEAALLAGHGNTALLRLQNFIASVRNLMNRRQLPHELGQPLIDVARAIINQINLP